jgi:hypothetical protein
MGKLFGNFFDGMRFWTELHENLCFREDFSERKKFTRKFSIVQEEAVARGSEEKCAILEKIGKYFRAN